MSGSFSLSPRSAFFRFPIFGDDFLDSFFDGQCPEGTKTYKKDLLDNDGKKIGTSVVRTYSSGRSNAPSDIVGSNYPPCNIFTDEDKKKVYEFAIAGYDPDNVSFEVNEENPSYINLVLKSGMTEVKDSDKEEPTEESSIVYDYQKFTVKDHVCPFYVDRDRYDIEKSEVSFKNGVVRISFEPKKILFSPKLIKAK